MKTFIKSLVIGCSLSFIGLSAAFAAQNPIGHPAAVATYKAGIYTTKEGKLSIALDKEAGAPVDLRLKNSKGDVYFSQHLNKKAKTFRIRLDVSELPDGDYQVEISNGAASSVQLVTISTQSPTTSSRLVAIN